MLLSNKLLDLSEQRYNRRCQRRGFAGVQVTGLQFMGSCLLEQKLAGLGVGGTSISRCKNSQ